MRTSFSFCVRMFLVCAALAAPSHAAEPREFTAPTGPDGAGFKEDGSLRLYGEFGFHTQNTRNLGPQSALYLNWLFGAGIHVSENVEIEVQLPMAHSAMSSNFLSTDQAAFGNLGLGANWMTSSKYVLWKVGGLVTFGPWNDNASFEQSITLQGASGTRGSQDLHLWAPGRVGLLVPARVELGRIVRFTADARLGMLLPAAGERDTELTMLLAPGVAVDAKILMFGLRLPVNLVPTATGVSEDGAQVNLEPYARLNVGPLFASTRFIMNLDEPLGFSFDTGRVWGLHFAGGLSF